MTHAPSPWLLKPELFTTVERWVGVETQGKYTRGMTVVDYYYLTGNKPNATLMVDVDRQGFVDLLADRLKFLRLITRRMTSRHPAPLISLRLERTSLELIMTTFRA